MDLYDAEMRSTSNEELALIKQAASWKDMIPWVGGLSLAGAGGYYLGSSSADEQLEKMRQENIKRNLLSAGAGATAAILSRKPVQGF